MEIEPSVPDDMYWQAESLANRMGISKSELFCRAISDYIKGCEAAVQDNRPAGDLVQEALDAVYSREESGVDEMLAKMQWASLPRESW